MASPVATTEAAAASVSPPVLSAPTTDGGASGTYPPGAPRGSGDENFRTPPPSFWRGTESTVAPPPNNWCGTELYSQSGTVAPPPNNWCGTELHSQSVRAFPSYTPRGVRGEGDLRARPPSSLRGAWGPYSDMPSSFATPPGPEGLDFQAHPGFTGGLTHQAFMAPGPRPARFFPADGFFHGPYRPMLHPYQYQPFQQDFGYVGNQGYPPVQGSPPVHVVGREAQVPSCPPQGSGGSSPPQSEGTAPDCDNSSLASEEHDRECVDPLDTEDSFSLSDAVGRLALVCPKLVGSAQESTSSRSAAERLMGLNSAKAGAARLVESETVARAVSEAQLKARGGAEPPSPGAVPNLPTALAHGVFLKTPKPPVKRSAIVGSSWPQAPSQASQEDLLLLGDAKSERYNSRLVSVKEPVMKEWEHLALLGLTAVSAMDSFFGGLVSSIGQLDKQGIFHLREEINTEDVSSFVSATSKNLTFLADAFATLQMNVTLCRRDAILSQSEILKKSASTKNSLRAVPIGAPALFGGGHIPPTIHGLAETRRDLVFALPRQAPRTSNSAQGRHSQAQKPSSSQSRYSFSRNRGGKTASSPGFRKHGGKPYDRRQASKADSKPSPQ